MNPPLLDYTVRYYLRHPWKIVRELWQGLRYSWQRSTRGWAVCDTWQADVYIATIIAEMCTHIATHGVGTPYPFFEEEHGDEAYTAYLQKVGQAFQAYVSYMQSEESLDDIGSVRYRQLIKDMHCLFDHFSTICD